MRTKHYSRLLLLLMFVPIILTGCIGSEGEHIKKRGDEAIDYLEEKYGENFTPITYGFGDYFSDTDTVECYPDWMDLEQEHVTVFLHSDGTYGDNYFEFYNRENLENWVKEKMGSEFGSDIKIYQSCSDSELPPELNKGSTIEEFYEACPDYIFSAHAYVRESDILSEDELEIKIASVSDRLCDTGASFLIYVYVIDPSVYESVSRFDRSIVSDAYDQENKADGVIVKNVGKIRIVSGNVK